MRTWLSNSRPSTNKPAVLAKAKRWLPPLNQVTMP
jgi:hypothetical protein